MSNSCHKTHDLLEDWPSDSSSSIETGELEQQVDEFSMNAMPKPKSEPSPRVSFSKTSLLNVYNEDKTYKKAYSKIDYDLFRISMLLHARQVKELISIAPPDSTKDSVKFLIESKVIDIADLVGVEHYVLGNGGFAIKARKLHKKKVLQQQLELQQHQPEDRAESLAEVAKDSSLESIHHARIRSAVVASYS